MEGDSSPRGNATFVARRQGLVVVFSWLPSLKGGLETPHAGR